MKIYDQHHKVYSAKLFVYNITVYLHFIVDETLTLNNSEILFEKHLTEPKIWSVNCQLKNITALSRQGGSILISCLTKGLFTCYRGRGVPTRWDNLHPDLKSVYMDS